MIVPDFLVILVSRVFVFPPIVRVSDLGLTVFFFFRILRISYLYFFKPVDCAGLYCYCGGRGFVFSPVVGVGDLGALELPPPPNQTNPPPASPH